MKLPSLHYLIQSARQSFLRFPLTIVSSLISVGIGIYLTECHKDISNLFSYINVMLYSALGIPFFFCADVFSASKDFSKMTRCLIDLGAAVILIILYFTLPNIDSTQNTSLPYIRYGIYNITIHLVVAFVPFLGNNQLNGFWHYNKILFVRFLTAMVYSAFLYGGLALALASLDFLVAIDLHEELFFELFILIGGFFNTWFFISGIPEKFNSLEEIREYPKGIKIFSQFVLLPLLILYLLILYGYTGKIVILWSWPKGIVSYLIACVAVLGILTLLLIHPYGNLSGNTWIKKFSKAYYFILFPLVVLLFIAIGMRISDYGITINRYVIILLGVWLTIVCVYFVFRQWNIKFIPISLAVILIVVSFGYWGMFSVSERSQVNRLKEIIEQVGVLKANKIQHEVMWQKDSLPTLYSLDKENINEEYLNDSLHNEIKSILDYLDNHHGFASIEAYYQQNIDSVVKLTNLKKVKWNRLSEAEVYMRSMGLSYEYRYKSSKDSYFDYSSVGTDEDAINISGYNYLIRFNISRYEDRNVNQSSFKIEGTLYSIRYSPLPANKLFVIASNDTIHFNMNEIIDKLISTYGKKDQSSIPDSEMRLNGLSNQIEVKVELNSISFDLTTDTLRVNNIAGNLFIRKRE